MDDTAMIGEGTGRRKTVEVVTHCHRYATLLRFQLSSLVLWPPDSVDVVLTVFYNSADSRTVDALKWFDRQGMANVRRNWIEQPLPQLCRRSLGRNHAALNSSADWIWFCDADYWFTQECWASFAMSDFLEHVLIFPRHIHAQKRAIHGDRLIETTVRETGIVQAPLSLFREITMTRAIGGVQIVRGDVCRTQGYLKDVARAQGERPDGIWRRTFEDVWFRKSLGTRGTAVDIKGIYRIRHTKNGRSMPGLEF